MDEALRLTGVRAGYGPTVVLEDVELLLPARGSLAVLGRNGVGKTTLLATIMGHTTLHTGSIEYQCRPITRLPVYERARLGIGYVPQTRDIFPSLSVEENLRVAALAGRWGLAQVYELFPRLAERRRHMGNQISGGEPLEGLAPMIIEVLLKGIRRLMREEALAVILVEQSAKLALEITEEALVLERGRIIHRGPSAELLADPARLANLIVTV
jgi:branched-chain amino acid transport system ATP-binding protein